MTAPRTSLATTLDEAKKQLGSRKEKGRQLYLNGSRPNPERMQWHTQNIEILRWMFTSGEISESYRRLVEKAFEDGGLADSTMRIALEQLQSVIDLLPMFVPSKEALASTAADSPRGSQTGPTGRSAPPPSSARWEFYSCLVADPSSAVDANKSMKLDEALARLSKEGWELVSAVSARQGEAHGKNYSEYYRLFLKRLIR